MRSPDMPKHGYMRGAVVGAADDSGDREERRERAYTSESSERQQREWAHKGAAY